MTRAHQSLDEYFELFLRLLWSSTQVLDLHALDGAPFLVGVEK